MRMQILANMTIFSNFLWDIPESSSSSRLQFDLDINNYYCTERNRFSQSFEISLTVIVLFPPITVMIKLFWIRARGHNACEIAVIHKVLAKLLSIFCNNFFRMEEPELENNTSNCFENRISDRKPYFKAGYVFKFEKFRPKTKLHAKTINFDAMKWISSPMKRFWSNKKRSPLARLEILACKFS